MLLSLPDRFAVRDDGGNGLLREVGIRIDAQQALEHLLRLVQPLHPCQRHAQAGQQILVGRPPGQGVTVPQDRLGIVAGLGELVPPKNHHFAQVLSGPRIVRTLLYHFA